jgi:hypothetical protein
MVESERKIVMYDNQIRVRGEKSHLLAGIGFLLIMFGLISFGYKNGSHAISDLFTYGMLLGGIFLIIIDFSAGSKK